MKTNYIYAVLLSLLFSTLRYFLPDTKSLLYNICQCFHMI